MVDTLNLSVTKRNITSTLNMVMVGNITWRQIKNLVFAHPLYAESLNNLFMKLEED